MGSGLGFWSAVGGLPLVVCFWWLGFVVGVERQRKLKRNPIKNPGPQRLSCSPGW